MFLPRFLKDAFRQDFFKSVVLLVGGTAFSQIVAVATLPVLTRLYSPDDFEMLAVFSGIVSTLSVSACLRYDVAIPLSKDDSEAFSLLIVAIISSLLVGAVSLIAVASYLYFINGAYAHSPIRPYVWLLPLCIASSGAFSALQYWFVREKWFREIAVTRGIQAIGGASIQIGLGAVSASFGGLIFGYVFTNVAGILKFSRRAFSIWGSHVKLRALNLRSAAVEFRRFPQYSALDALANSAGVQVPIVLIAAWSIGGEAGYLMLAMKVMQVPIRLVGGAIGQVYLSRAPDEDRCGNLSRFSIGIVARLVKSGFGPLLFLGIVSPCVFPLLFGSGWERSGEIVGWMTPWFMLQFISSPISMVMHVRGKQKQMLALTLVGCSLRLGAIFLANVFLPNWVTEAYAISGFVFYLGSFFVFAQVSEILSSRGLLNVLIKSIPSVASWAGLGVCIMLLIRFVSP